MPADDDENNPFVAFRKVVDSQASAVFSILSELPSQLSAQLSSIRNDIRKNSEASSETTESALKRLGDAYERSTNPTRTQTVRREAEETTSASQARQTREERHTAIPSTQQNSDLPQEANTPPSLLPITLAAMLLGNPHHTNPFEDTIPHHFDPIGAHHHSTWPDTHFFATSRYSPLRLEQHQASCNDAAVSATSTKWRDAFEDLLRAERGELLPERGPGDGRKAASAQSPGEWLDELQNAGLISRAVRPERVEWTLEHFRNIPSSGFGSWHGHGHGAWGAVGGLPHMMWSLGRALENPWEEDHEQEQERGPSMHFRTLAQQEDARSSANARTEKAVAPEHNTTETETEPETDYLSALRSNLAAESASPRNSPAPNPASQPSQHRYITHRSRSVSRTTDANGITTTTTQERVRWSDGEETSTETTDTDSASPARRDAASDSDIGMRRGEQSTLVANLQRLQDSSLSDEERGAAEAEFERQMTLLEQQNMRRLREALMEDDEEEDADVDDDMHEFSDETWDATPNEMRRVLLEERNRRRLKDAWRKGELEWDDEGKVEKEEEKKEEKERKGRSWFW